MSAYPAPHTVTRTCAQPPVIVFEAFRDEPYCFFLDSSHPNGDTGRYSFLGSTPFCTFSSVGTRITVQRGDAVEHSTGDPFAALQRLLDAYRTAPDAAAPFAGGAVGYFGYDLGRVIETLPDTTVKDDAFPDCFFGFYDSVVIYDHETTTYTLAVCPFDGVDVPACIAALDEKLQRAAARPPETATAKRAIHADVTRDLYCAAVTRAKKYIVEGDIYQVNLSQRFSAPLATSPYDLYKRLRRHNPAPFSCFLRMGPLALASTSPERFLRRRGRELETRPIKGTVPRGQTPEEDEAQVRALCTSEKDRAENIMIVDLERNDLGKVCDYGSVRVTALTVPEKYATVIHLVSTVCGTVRDGVGAVGCVRACFPGGSITGAPKIRSMEIIEELEHTKRSIYTGSIGWFGFDGDMDCNIAIRTALIDETRGTVTFQAGGGIVADSDEAREYDETLHKVRAIFDTLME